jgi:hypothetical protein
MMDFKPRIDDETPEKSEILEDALSLGDFYISDLLLDAEQIEELISDLSSEITELSSITDSKIDILSIETDSKIDNLSNTTDSKIKELSDTTNSRISELSIATDSKIDDLTDSTNTKISELSIATDNKINNLSIEVHEKIDNLSNTTDSKIKELSTLTFEKIDILSTETDKKIENLSNTTDSKITKLSTETNSRINVLSGNISSINDFLPVSIIEPKITISSNLSVLEKNKENDLSISVDFDPGKYSFNQETGVKLTALSISFNNSETYNIFPSKTCEYLENISSDLSISISASYGDGVTPKTIIGYDNSSKISADTIFENLIIPAYNSISVYIDDENNLSEKTFLDNISEFIIDTSKLKNISVDIGENSKIKSVEIRNNSTNFPVPVYKNEASTIFYTEFLESDSNNNTYKIILTK